MAPSAFYHLLLFFACCCLNWIATSWTAAIGSRQRLDSSSVEDFALTLPLEDDKWFTFGNVTSFQSRRGGILISGYSNRGASLQIGSIWSKKALPAGIVLSRDFNWEVKANLITHTSPSADHEHGFGMWIATGETIFPESQWSVAPNNFTGVGIFVAEYGDFADSSSQLVDVYGVVGQEVRLNAWPDAEDIDDETYFMQPKRDRGHCSISSWDVDQRETKLIVRKEGGIATIRFSACDDFELDLSGLIEANSQQKIRSKFYIGLSFWTNQQYIDAVQILKFEFQKLPRGQAWLVHDDMESEEDESNTNYPTYEQTNHNIFNFPHREIKVESLSLSPPYKRQLASYWKLIGIASGDKQTATNKEIIRLTGVKSASGVGGLLSRKPLERRLIDNYSAWQMEAIFRRALKSERTCCGGLAIWFSTDKPVVNNTEHIFRWNGSFTGFAMIIETAQPSSEKSKPVNVMTVIGRHLDLEWGERASKTNWALKCVMQQSQLPTSPYSVILKKQGNNIYASFAHCLLIFDISAILPMSDPSTFSLKSIPLLRLGVAAWSSDVYNYRDIQRVTFSEIVRVAAAAPVFASDPDTVVVTVSQFGANQEVELDCEHSWVYPKPNIHWKKISGSSSDVVASAVDQPVLTISADNSLDADRYTCIVTNSLGNISRTFFISYAQQRTSQSEHAKIRFWVSVSSFILGIAVVITTTTILYCAYRCKFKPQQQQQQQQRLQRTASTKTTLSRNANNEGSSNNSSTNKYRLGTRQKPEIVASPTTVELKTTYRFPQAAAEC